LCIVDSGHDRTIALINRSTGDQQIMLDATESPGDSETARNLAREGVVTTIHHDTYPLEMFT